MLDYGKRKIMAKEYIYEFTLKKKVKKQVETKRKKQRWRRRNHLV